MKIEVTVNKPVKVEVGDIVESKHSGIMYLITKNEFGKYSWTDLTNNRCCNILFDSLEEAVNSASTSYKLYKAENIKLIIE